VGTIAGLKEQLDREGFVIMPQFISAQTVERLKSSMGHLGKRAGIRQLPDKSAAIADFLKSDELKKWVEVFIPGGFPVRAIFFDKTADANWKVPWHQDLAICVRDRSDVTGFIAWTVKEGVVHVQPPPQILERMLTIRLCLDDCGPDKGPLSVIPRSHACGRLTAEQIAKFQISQRSKTCLAPAGGAILMRPLLLHSSSAARTPTHRRVLHIEFAAEALPNPLRWVMQSI
jgi:hypothetical protein